MAFPAGHALRWVACAEKYKTVESTDLNTLIKKIIRLRIFYDKNLHTESMRGNIIVVCSVVEALLKDLIESDTSNYKFAVESLKSPIIHFPRPLMCRC